MPGSNHKDFHDEAIVGEVKPGPEDDGEKYREEPERNRFAAGPGFGALPHDRAVDLGDVHPAGVLFFVEALVGRLCGSGHGITLRV